LKNIPESVVVEPIPILNQTSIENPVIDNVVSKNEAESKVEPKIVQTVAKPEVSNQDIALKLFQMLKHMDINTGLSMISSAALFLVYVLNRRSESRIGRLFRLMEQRFVQTIKMATASL
jgi:hypothetical protein